MSRISVFELQSRVRRARGLDADDVDFGDAFGIAVSETLRTLPTATIARGARNLFDSSESIAPEEANVKFNLQGEAAFAPDDEVTMDQASERASDQARLARNQYIQGLYASENPTMSTVANVTGSLAAGFLDPTLIALNVGTSVALTQGLGRLAASKVGSKAINAVGAFDSGAGKALIQMYDLKAQQTLKSVVMREGAENFTASVLEESFNFAGVGEERLARSVSTQESLRNIVIGTAIGTGLGTGIDRAGRAGMMSRWNRLFGDKAPDVADAESKLVQLESDAGVTPDVGFVAQKADQDVFEAKEWHPTADARTANAALNPKDTTFYVPKDNNTFKSVSNRGKGTVLTDNHTQAMNMGKDVDKVKLTEDAEILTPDMYKNDEVLKQSIAEDMASDITRMIDPLQQEALTRKLYGDDGDDLAAVEIDELEAIIAGDIRDKESIDEVIEYIEELSTVAEIETSHHNIIDEVLEVAGFDGYTFAGKGATGDTKYSGLNLNESGRAKIVKTGETKVPEPTFQQKTQKNLREAKAAENYAQGLEKRIREANTPEEHANMLPEELELDDEFSLEDAYVTHKKTKESVDNVFDDLEARRKEGTLKTEEEKLYQTLSEVKQGRKIEDTMDEVMEQVDAYDLCMFPAKKAKAKKAKSKKAKEPKFAPDDIGF